MSFARLIPGFVVMLVAACEAGSGELAGPTGAAGLSAGGGAPAGSGGGAGVPAANGGTAGNVSGAGGSGNAGSSGSSATAGTMGGSGASGSAGNRSGSGGTAAGASGGGAPAGAGAPAAGSGGAGAAGGGAGAAAGGGCTGAAFCDSFEAEGTAPATAVWEVVTPNCSGDAAVEIDSTVAFAGKRSAKVRSSGGYCNHLFLQAKTSGALPDPLFVRLYMRLDKVLTSSHVTFLAMKDGADGKDLRMGGQSEILMWNRESDDATLPELSPSGIALSLKPAAQTWMCVEFEVDSQNRNLHTWVDGKPVAGLQVDGEGTPDIDAQWRRNASWQPKPQNVKLGWESYGSDANTVWFDEVALRAARIGCNP